MNSSTSTADLRQRLIDGPYKLTERQADNFVAKVKFGADGECWEWMGARNRSGGYGTVKIRRKMLKAHRIAGGVGGEDHALHRCDNPGCVHPQHIKAGTRAENMRDMAKKGRSAHGERHPNAKLTASHVMEIRARYASGDTQQQIADDYDCSRQLIGLIVNRVQWKHLPDAA